MNEKQNSCLILGKQEITTARLSGFVRGLGYIVQRGEGFLEPVTFSEEPDLVLLGESLIIPDNPEILSDLELYVRECQIPVLAPKKYKNTLLKKFDEVHIYTDLEMAQDMIEILIAGQSRRRQVRDKMVQAVAGIKQLEEGCFGFKSLLEAQALAVLLSAIAPEKKSLRLGLTELFINSVEHGNLRINAAEKILLRNEGRWLEEVERRLQNPEFADKEAQLFFKRRDGRVHLRLEDDGEGFEWQNHLAKDVKAAGNNKAGRGIFIIKRAGLEDLIYLGKGNIVECSFDVSSNEGSDD